MRGRGALIILLPAILAGPTLAQRVQQPPTSGAAALELVLRRLGTTAVFMITNAHPDDENNALIAMLARGLGVRVVEATATRGEGGQNDLGTEEGLALSVVRTDELLSAHRIDGAEQVFTRSVDFGYSFSVDETFEKWGKDEILADYTRLIRMIRPDVILTMTPDGGGGGQHHQASARITREAFDAAADPARFPDQIAAGLRPWRAARLYIPFTPPESRPASRPADSRRAESRRAESAPASRPGDIRVDADVFDPVLGATYAELGSLARSMHKTQGMARLLALPGASVSHYRLGAGTPAAPVEAPRTPLSRVAAELGLDMTLGGLKSGIPAIDARLEWLGRATFATVAAARRAASRGDLAAAVDPLADHLSRLRRVRADLAREDPAAVYDLDRRLARKESELTEAIAIASGLRLEAVADAGVVVPGQEVTVSVYVASGLPADVAFDRVTFTGFDPAEGGCATRPKGKVAPDSLVTCESKLRIPKDARVTSAHWKRIPGTARSEWEPDVPFGAPFRPTPFRARIELRIAGEPIAYEIPVDYRDPTQPLAGEKRHELLVVPPKGDDRVVQRIEYAHTRRRHLVEPTRAAKEPDTKLALPLTVGYVTCDTDSVRDVIARLGARVEVIDGRDVAKARKERFPVVVIGNRACELSAGARETARDLLKYAEAGGTVIVLYQRSGLDENNGAPYAAKTGGNRVTDETAPVRVLVPGHPVFNVPNKLGPEDWAGWVDERGRSFLETKDPRYVDLVEIEDPFEFNKGPKRGAFVEARVGKGRWLYVGLSLQRQLEAGVPGAYRLLANLLSLRGDESP